MNLFRRLLTIAAFSGLGTSQAAEPIRLPNHPALSPDGNTVAFDWNGDIWSVPITGGVAKPLTANPAKDVSPKFSPDGKRIAFVSDRTGSNQIFLMPAGGGTPRQITFNTAGYDLLEWTPDGLGLLVESARDAGYGRRSSDRMFIVPLSEDPAARPAERMVFDDYGTAGTLSPNGRTVIFNREGTSWWRKGYKGSQGGQIWGYDRESKAYELLVNDGLNNFWPLWMADRPGFYYVGGADKTFNLYEFAGNNRRQITKYTDDGVAFPAISRDGKTIVFRQQFDLYRIRPGADETPSKIEIFRDDDRPLERMERRTLTTASEASFTADGLEIAFIAGGDVWVMDTELREPKRVTSTPEEERGVVFAPDGRSILFVSDKDGVGEIYRATRADEKKPWMLNNRFAVERVTTFGDVMGKITFSPDGAKVAFLRGKGNLWIADADGKNAAEFLKSWNAPTFHWSPDGKWLVYSVLDEDFNSDIWLKPLDGSRPAFNLSRHPYPDNDPVWSPDGKLIAWVGARDTKENYDIHYVYLAKEDGEKAGRDRSLEKALEKLQKGRSAVAPFVKEGEFQQPEPLPQPRLQGDEPARGEGKRAAPSKRPTNIAIDFEGIHERIRRVTIANVNENNLMFSPDSKRLAFTGSVDGSAGTYTIEIPDNLRPTLLSSQVAAGARWLKNGSIVGLVGGVPAALSVGAAAPAATPAQTGGGGGGGGRKGGLARAAAPAGEPAAPGSYRFTAYQEFDAALKNRAAFDMAWRVMRDNWYDARLGNRDWNAVRAKYLPVAETPDSETLATCISMMLGELNGSHLGYTPRAAAPAGRGANPAPEGTGGPWRDATAHFGARFDPNFAGPGWKVKDALPNTPADQKKTKLNPGDVIVAIDGRAIDNAVDPTVYLNGNPNRDVLLKVKDPAGIERELVIRPTAITAARAAAYEKWLKDNAAAVEKLSDGKLGYLHIQAMDAASFHKFEEALYNAGAGKTGLIIDVRENGGGSTADHLLTALTQPRHAIAIPRDGGPGYPQDRTVYATWNKPILVLCNQNSFSNAEIFSHAIKILNRGRLVGVPTAGGVVSTGAVQIMDLGTLRLPFRGWFKIDDGEDQELNGAVPHVVVWPKPGDFVRGIDEQLATGVRELLKDVAADNARPKPTPHRASERN